MQLGRAVYRKKHKVSIGIASLEIMGVTSSKVNDESIDRFWALKELFKWLRGL